MSTPIIPITITDLICQYLDNKGIGYTTETHYDMITYIDFTNQDITLCLISEPGESICDLIDYTSRIGGSIGGTIDIMDPDWASKLDKIIAYKK